MPGLDTNTKLLIHASKPPGFVERLNALGEQSATFYGNATTVDTESAFPGGYALSLDGVNSYISIPYADPVFAYGTVNFTIDFWAKFNELPTAESSADRPLYHANIESPKAYISMNLGISSGTRYISFYCEDTNDSCYVQGDVSVSTGVWYHIAVVRSSNVFTLYLNGTSIGTTTFTGTVPTVNTPVLVGKDDWSGYTNAYVDDYRITLGTALWTTNFTPPTEPAEATFTDYNHLTAALLPFYGPAITDASQSSHSLVSTSVDSTTDDKKFGDCGLEFNTTPTYLTVPDSSDWAFGTGDFTFDFWIKRISASYSSYMWQQAVNSSNKMELVITNSGTIYFFVNSGGTTLGYVQTTDAVLTDTTSWHHVAIVRNGTSAGCIKIYVDGASKTLTVSTDLAANSIPDFAANPKIGGTGSAIACAAYVDEYRVSNVARWTEDFTPPTEAYAELIPADIEGTLPEIECEISATADVVTILVGDLPEIIADLNTGAVIDGALPSIFGSSGILAEATATLPVITLDMQSNFVIFATLPTITTNSIAYTGRVASIDCALPLVICDIYTGADNTNILPTISVTSTATTELLAQISASLLAIQSSTSATTGRVSSADATLPVISGIVTAITDIISSMSANLLAIQGSTSTTTGRVSSADATLPVISGITTAITGIISSTSASLLAIQSSIDATTGVTSSADAALPIISGITTAITDIISSTNASLLAIQSSIDATTGVTSSADATLPVISGISNTGATLSSDIPRIISAVTVTVDAVAHMLGELNSIQAEAYTSAYIALELPSIEISATAIISGQIASITDLLPSITVFSSAVLNIQATISSQLSALTSDLVGLYNAISVNESVLPSISGVINSFTGSVGTIYGDLTAISSQLQSTADITAVISASLKSIVSVSTSLSARSGVTDKFTLSLNLLQKEVISTYTNYNFLSYAVINGKSVAGATNGFFLLEGNTDNLESITSKITTPALSFGTYLKKKVRGFRVGGKASGKVTVAVTNGTKIWYVDIDLADINTYKHRTGYYTHYTIGDFLTFSLVNKNGADMFISSLDLYMQILERY